MKRFTLVFILFFLFSFGLFAQSSSTASGGEKTTKAKKTSIKKVTTTRVSNYVLAAQRARVAREKNKKKSTLVITNQSLKDWTKSDRVNMTKAEKNPTPYRYKEPTDSSGKGEAYWRQAMKGAQARVKNLERQIKNLDSKVHRLETDYYNRDDPAYRDTVVKPAWDAALEQLEAAKKELQAAKEYLDNLPEKARKAGALPGWLR